jgi:type VI protein secretion system component Hcp
MKLSIYVLVMMLFLTACKANKNDTDGAGVVGEARPEVGGDYICEPGTRVYMGINGPAVISTDPLPNVEAHRQGWIPLLTIEEGRQIQDQVRMAKVIDSSSVILRKELALGTNFDEVRIEGETKCKKPVVVYQAILTQAALRTLQLDASSDDGSLMETLTWDYMHLETTYTSIDDKGGPGEKITTIKNGRLYWR